jgi:hypothetical protein
MSLLIRVPSLNHRWEDYLSQGLRKLVNSVRLAYL